MLENSRTQKIFGKNFEFVYRTFDNIYIQSTHHYRII